MSSWADASVTSVSDEYLFIGATYRDLPGADADFELLRQLHIDRKSTVALDAVTIARKRSGEVRFHQESGHFSGLERDGPATPSLAAGLAAALFPSVVADIPAGRRAEREILGTVAGAVATALGRAGLREVGTLLDSSTAGLIVAATTDQQDAALAVVANSRSTIARSAIVDVKQIQQMVGQLGQAASRRRRKGP